MFISYVLSEERKLKVQSEIKSTTIMCNMKSDRQARHAQNKSNKKFNHHRYTPIHQIQ